MQDNWLNEKHRLPDPPEGLRSNVVLAVQRDIQFQNRRRIWKRVLVAASIVWILLNITVIFEFVKSDQNPLADYYRESDSEYLNLYSNQ